VPDVVHMYKSLGYLVLLLNREHEQNNKVLIHCNSDYQQPLCIITAFIMYKCKMSLNAALIYINKTIEFRNISYIQALYLFEEDIHA